MSGASGLGLPSSQIGTGLSESLCWLPASGLEDPHPREKALLEEDELLEETLCQVLC